ncbi:MAG: homoserine O-succinyltransferase, partial [Paramuribaculum sp.]|nr:homoserine O-succinyltransferase [Paramuribaculum sp.]
MPALLPADFPAAEILRGEGLTTLLLGAAEADATIGFINLMPNKVDTEVDFLRLINAAGRNVEFVPIKMVTHKSRHAPAEHLERFYSAFDDVACRLDGVIITGAPLDDVAFEDVTYWREITAIMDWLHERRTPIYIYA